MTRTFYSLLTFVLVGFLALPVQCEGQNPSTSATYREAYDKGYADGLEAGRKDRQQERLFDFANRSAFQRADQGFDPSRHDRDVFSVAYRRGFEDGYEDGYQSEPGVLTQTASPPSPPVAGSKPVSPPKTRGTTRIVDVSQGGALTVPKGTELRIKLLDTLTTQRNERGDFFRAEVVEDMLVGQIVAIPEGTRLNGKISSLKRAGRIKGRAEMDLRFDTLEFSDGRTVPIEAMVVSVEGRSDGKVKEEEGTVQAEGSKGEDAKRVGVSSGIGALIGVLTGGKRGAGRGAAAGGVAGLAGVLITRGRDLYLYSETEMIIRLQQEMRISNP